VPELASRDHVRFCLPLVEAALDEAGLGRGELAGSKRRGVCCANTTSPCKGEAL